MSISLEEETRKVQFNNEPLDISIPLKFGGKQPNAYGVETARSNPVKAGELVGDTRQGGSVNFEQYTFIPHCNGTHTECVGHITNERISVRGCLKDSLMRATLISVEPEEASDFKESYSAPVDKNDALITRSSISAQISKTTVGDALIVRTIPNSDSKLEKKYGDYVPPFFSSEAMDLIVEIGVKHLLVDLPSIDRIFDGGKLSNHRKFWMVEEGKFEINDETRVSSTITELIYVPNKIADGEYLLNLQIAPFESDTSPSRPVLFRV